MEVMVLKKGYSWNFLRNWPRNLPCFCGSKIKFKKCCSNKLVAAIPDDKAKEIAQAILRAQKAK